MKKGGDRPRSHVAVIDKTYANLHHCHSDIVKSNLTLKDRAALNMKAFDSEFIFGTKQ